MAIVKTLKSTVTGLDMYNAIRNDAVTNEFRERIPEGTLTNLKDVQQAMAEYTPSYNEFMSALINRIGLVLLNYKLWQNPLGQFKRKLEYGQTIEEIQTDLIKSELVDPKETNDPFKKNIPPVGVIFHNVDRQQTYTVTINEDRVRTAFISWDGIKQLTDSVIQSMYNQYYLDDYLCCREVLFDALEHKKGLMVPCPYVQDEDTGKNFLKLVKLYAEKMHFLTNKYNAYGFYTFTDRQSLVLFVTPDTKNVLDVDVLAYVFQASMTNIDFQVIVVDELPYGVSGVLCDAEFLRIYNYTERSTSLFNPKDLSTQYFLNTRNVYSSSIFKNFIGFADPAKISTFQIKPTEGSVTGTSGGSLNFTTTIEYTPGIVFEDCVPVYSVAPAKEGVTIDADSGILTFTPGAATTGETYTVTATSSLDSGVTSTATVTVK